MGKRSDFARVERDFYPTPIKAVEPLIDHLPMREFMFVEPCAGDGRLIKHIWDLTEGHGVCGFASDIEPAGSNVSDSPIKRKDALSLLFTDIRVDFCITNPPWERKFLHEFIEWYVPQMPTWLLFDADWMHTKQSAMYMTYCKKVVSVGRVKWIEGSKSVGKDNCCWYLFDYDHKGPTEFCGRLLSD